MSNPSKPKETKTYCYNCYAELLYSNWTCPNCSHDNFGKALELSQPPTSPISQHCIHCGEELIRSGERDWMHRTTNRMQCRDQVEMFSDITWKFYPSQQYLDLQELAGFDPAGNRYYLITTPCGRICLRKNHA